MAKKGTVAKAGSVSPQNSRRVKPPKYKVGQVVALSKLDFYKCPERIGEFYQVITAIEPWGVKGYPGWCLTFANRDKCHESWVRPLTVTEIGIRRKATKRKPKKQVKA
jgi:hypothetical protein